MGKLDGRVALVTGAGGGLGAAMARRFTAEGARVVLADRDPESVALLAKNLGAAADPFDLDVASEEGWDRIRAHVLSTHGRLDVLVNNAGIHNVVPLVALAFADYKAIVEVNQFGTFLGMRACAPLLALSGGGSIVNVSSLAGGVLGSPCMTAYAATKAAIRGMTLVAAAELGHHKIRVNAIYPGIIRTPMMPMEPDLTGESGGMFAPLKRVGEADEVANLALFLASDDSTYCTGQDFVIDGGMSSRFGPDVTQGMAEAAMDQALKELQ
jgi:3alpha(or 20beta)-hydroxysteroid dehydrogenase